MTNKSIDINQRIPLETLHVALESYLTDSYSDDYILEQLRIHFSGENRLKKSVRIVRKIIINNPIQELIETNKAEILAALKSNTDRNVILISLLNSSFIFSFDTLSTFGKLFKVQDVINSESLLREVSKVYGSNRALPNGLYSVVPMFLEANFFSRPKQGLYEINDKLSIANEITQKLYIESYKTHHSLDEIQDYQLMEPYFEFLTL
jgi:hypothetical protein